MGFGEATPEEPAEVGFDSELRLSILEFADLFTEYLTLTGLCRGIFLRNFQS